MKRLYGDIILFLVVVNLFCAPLASAEDSFDGVPLPAGTLGTLVYYDQTEGNKLYNGGNKLSEDFNLIADVGIWRGVYYHNIGPFTASSNLLLPFGTISVNGAAVGNNDISSSGMGDPLFCEALWLLNDPGKMTWGGIAAYVTMPFGQYDNEKLVNLGSNRWAFRPMVSFTKGLGNGFFIDSYVSVEFYTKNDEYGPGKVGLEQDPLCNFETHLIQHLDPKTFISVDYFYHIGGETEIAGVNRDDKQKDHAMQLTLARMITENTQLMLKYKSDLSVENGPKTGTFGLRLAYLIPEFGKKESGNAVEHR